MIKSTPSLTNVSLLEKFRALFIPRDFILHDGSRLRRFTIGARTQMVAAMLAAFMLCFSAYGVAHAAAGAVVASGLVGDVTPEAKLARMQRDYAAMQADVQAIRIATKAHAARVEQRQAMIAAVLAGRAAPAQLAQTPAVDGSKTSAIGKEVIAPMQRIEARQVAFAAQARATIEQRFRRTASQVKRLGLRPERLMPAMGGPYEPVDATDVAVAGSAAEAAADAQFRSLFMTWKKLDTLEQAVISIPSLQPVEHLTLTSNFGVRTDPFRGTAAMHAGIDIPGPLGTPVFATADGVVGRAQRAGGYGNMIEINHGRGIETRYGHLSKILVEPNTKVRRGQIIGLMGSTGRSTGSHLHYEVRIDGVAVNPIPYLQTSDTLVAIQDRALRSHNAQVGGPAASD